MRKKIVLGFTLAGLALALSGCGGNKTPQSSVSVANSITDSASTVSGFEIQSMQSDPEDDPAEPTEDPSSQGGNGTSSQTEEKKVEKIIFTHSEPGAEFESAVIEGVAADGEVVWQKETKKAEPAELSKIAEITSFDHVMFWYLEDGEIVALNWNDGTERFRNDDFRGASPTVDVDLYGRIVYIAGYYGPALYGIDYDGNTVCRIDDIGDYYWPVAIDSNSDEDTLTVTFEGEPGGTAVIDKKTYTQVTG